jgi:hypothetical protein
MKLIRKSSIFDKVWIIILIFFILIVAIAALSVLLINMEKALSKSLDKACQDIGYTLQQKWGNENYCVDSNNTLHAVILEPKDSWSLAYQAREVKFK